MATLWQYQLRNPTPLLRRGSVAVVDKVAATLP